MKYEFYIWLPTKLISLLAASSEYLVKVMKFLYDVSEAGNHAFATYPKYYKNKFIIKDLRKNFCFFYRSDWFYIMKMQIDNILILADNNFAKKKKIIIQTIKIITKDWEHFIFSHSLKFNGAQIKLNLSETTLAKESHVDKFFLLQTKIYTLQVQEELLRKSCYLRSST